MVEIKYSIIHSDSWINKMLRKHNSGNFKITGDIDGVMTFYGVKEDIELFLKDLNNC